MINAVIVDTVRTPMGRSKNGVFRYTRAEKLMAHLLEQILVRAPQLDPHDIDDVIIGCVKQTKEQGFNIARSAAIIAGIPFNVPAQTVNRLCGSSMQAIHDASMAIKAGLGDVYIIGGVEHMGHVPMNYELDFAPELNIKVANNSANMGLTAEQLAEEYNISRELQDEFAFQSHTKAHAATVNGGWDNEIVPTLGHLGDGTIDLITEDEVIRSGCTLESLSKLSPVFDLQAGSVTAGNASAMSDGASAMLIMSESKAKELGLKPRARIVSQAVSGCAPARMGLGPVEATKKALFKAGINVHDIDLAEFNEAFSAQALSCIKELGMIDDLNKINIKGGAIALGHPLGCSGSRITGTLLNNLEQQNKKIGLATMCIGFGQGIATIIEIVK
ncbi:acetyl-CoA C-acyltransferase FadA [Brumicola pallidula]|uniref:acetyl-CoA C-acyltransferase n=1 Tax=Brumicola pallidula DSM 14239 = ACAM 615 TaxID=1121922 RepID=K7A0K3_9ALTE|nr:acetyl-CoA C-acyltransferase FadA [Glaciecola pallidula]GAC29050.1 3-ketoacyl-CoA thiolase [Glaciecola pallidula DSM 14239 = ACAM 615]